MTQENGGRAERTISKRLYTDRNFFDSLAQSLFAPSWQFLTADAHLKAAGQVLPITVLENFLDQPILLTRSSDDRINCLSNVCTHRGNLLVEGPCNTTSLRCRYHGRRFGLEGQFISAPGFEGAPHFPKAVDSLPHVPLKNWKTLLFAKVTNAAELFSFDELMAPIEERLGWLPLHEFIFDPATSRDYLVQANWALYCENYLEGLHIPYIHPDLANAIDTKNYATELFNFSSLQTAIASSPGESFTLLRHSPDYGKDIGAYYFFCFPNMMFNFYPWGLSINVVKPLSLERTRVSFLSYIWDEAKIACGAGAALDRVEREDEDIVEKVQQGIRSNFYQDGSYSPEWEQGVHHFHSLLKKFMP
jgi:choline monooxygenase